MDLAIEVPGSPLEAVMSLEVWQEIYARLIELVESHRTTLIFVNTRRLAERMAHQLSEQIGAEHVAAHHGSLAKEVRLAAETRLKEGGLKVLVATASLELASTSATSTSSARSPRRTALPPSCSGSGARVTRCRGCPRAPLPTHARRPDRMRGDGARGEGRRARPRDHPRQAARRPRQQVVAEAAAEEWDEEALRDLFRRAWPYRDLTEREFSDVVAMLATGYATKRGRRAALLHYDAVHRKLRARSGSRLTAIQSGGAIPEVFDYRVRLEPRAARPAAEAQGRRGRQDFYYSLPQRRVGDPDQLGLDQAGARQPRAQRVHPALAEPAAAEHLLLGAPRKAAGGRPLRGLLRRRRPVLRPVGRTRPPRRRRQADGL